MRRSASSETWLPFGVTVRVVADVLRGLHAAHELRGDDGALVELVHRDVSPHNVLVGVDGISKIGDFGIAKAIGQAAEQTATGQIKGKLAYLAPEQFRRERIDRRVDVYAAGIVLWEALTGARLFAGRDEIETIELVRRGEVVDPREHSPAPPRVAEVCLRALDRDRARRFSTAEAMADALEEAGRTDGALATSQEVSRLVRGMCGSKVDELRRTLRGRGPRADRPSAFAPASAARADATTPHALATGTATASAPSKARRAWMGAGVATVALSIALAGGRVALVRGRPANAPASVAAEAPQAEASVAPPSVPPASPPSAGPADDALPSGTLASATNVSKTSPRPATPLSSSATRSAPLRGSAGPDKVRPDAGARPRFANPYEGQ